MSEYEWSQAAGHWRLNQTNPTHRERPPYDRLFGYMGALMPRGKDYSVIVRDSMNPSFLPGDLTLDEALDAAKLLILSRSKT